MTLPKTTQAWILANKPVGDIQKDTFKLEKERPLPELKDGDVLVQTLYLSNDPAQRGWIQKDADPDRLYVPPVPQDSVMRARGLGKVLASNSEKYKEGDVVSGGFGWAQYAVLPEKEVLPNVPVPGQSPSIAISALGLTGITAWAGVEKVGLFKSGQSLIVSGAAGATGSAVVQIAKKIFGASYVVGIAGGADKCKWVESLGADKCLDYKSKDFEKELKALQEFDLYFDNVGGSILNAVFPKIKRYGRIAVCGSIAAYNDASANAFPNWFEVISNRITVQGFIVMDYASEFGSIREKLAQAIKDGKFSTEGAETVVETKFEDVPKTWYGLFEGKNQGKLITKFV